MFEYSYGSWMFILYPAYILNKDDHKHLSVSENLWIIQGIQVTFHPHLLRSNLVSEYTISIDFDLEQSQRDSKLTMAHFQILSNFGKIIIEKHN